MKLIYQWLIVITLALIVFSLHVYAGTACSKNKVVPAAIAHLHEPLQKNKPDEVIRYKKPKKKKRKVKVIKIDIKQCKEVAEHLKWMTDDPDWYFCESSPNSVPSVHSLTRSS